MVLPDEAGTGAVPQSAANEASLRSLSGLPPAVMSSCAAVVFPTPWRCSRWGAAFSIIVVQFGVEFADLSGQALVAAREGLQCGQDQTFFEIWVHAGAAGCERLDQACRGEVAIFFPQVGRGRHQLVANLDLCCCSGFDS
ncbi:hypothetical protein JNB_20398 [Janibacter sp. HTCC2649]|nr:hypothetical protein JNB_20398 [Janibacter sp. HTCC2649]